MCLTLSLCILLLWKADKYLLDRIQLYLWNTSKWLLWLIFYKWIQIKGRNEMIKNGYHVDSVFLIERHETYSRKIDVLRVFRSEIIKETFTNEKSIEVSEFIALCSDPSSNFQYDAQYEYDIEVNYTYDQREYKIIYSTYENKHIRFPIYTESAIINTSATTGGLCSAYFTREKNQVLGERNIDISDEMMKYAGPIGNFYVDTEYLIRREWLVSSELIDEDSTVVLLDDWCVSHTLDKTEKYVKIPE